MDHPSSSPMLAAAGLSKHSSPCKPSCSAQSVGIPQEDHIYSEVDKSRKKPAFSSSRSPQTGLTHSTYATHESSKVDEKSIETDAKLSPDQWLDMLAMKCHSAECVEHENTVDGLLEPCMVWTEHHY